MEKEIKALSKKTKILKTILWKIRRNNQRKKEIYKNNIQLFSIENKNSGKIRIFTEIIVQILIFFIYFLFYY